MAKARMLHKTISVSIPVNKLSLPAKLLFTWMIPHADDEGRLRGELEYIKAAVVPMSRWSTVKIKRYLEEMKTNKLIYYWEQNGEWFIEFPAWKEYQKLRKDRRNPSNLPSFPKQNDTSKTTICQPDDNQEAPQANGSELNQKEFNESENSDNLVVADKNSFKSVGEVIRKNSFRPASEGEVAAKEAWEKLEPNNPMALRTTYLAALRQGLHPEAFYQFVSEIKQDNKVKSPGAVFNSKVRNYLAQREKGDCA